MQCETRFWEVFRTEPENIAFCPYRVCPLGAHIDHQSGQVTGFAIDRGIHLAYRAAEEPTVRLASLNFPGQAEFSLTQIPEKQNDWADHLRGAALVLGEAYPLTRGLDGVLEGTLSVGGISSSAAVILVFLTALCRINGITLTDREKITLARAAENRYVGVACGKLDQSCEVLCRKNQLLHLDNLDDSFVSIPQPVSMKPYQIGIFFSGLERSLASSRYNLRVDECRAAAYSLLAFGGIEYDSFGSTVLRDVPQELFDAYGDRLPEPFRRRAVHYFGEMARVQSGVDAWKRGDMDTFGQLCFESGQSSVENYECGCPELIALYEILRSTKGVFGGRFSGAGFKGCCMALIDPAYAEDIRASVTTAYTKAYPALAEKFSITFCHTADGVGEK